MVLNIGREDAFERKYVQKFRDLCADYGEVVLYERDRAGRDIGLHLTRRHPDGAETVSSAMCWFQLKGIQASSKGKLFDERKVRIRLEVKHLQFWYLQPHPTHLVVYVEALDQFYILNLHDYVEQRWSRSVFELKEKEVTIELERQSVLDAQAFNLILQNSSIADWIRVLGAEQDAAKLGVRDFQIIWRLGTAADGGAQHRIRFWRWLTKMRAQLWVEECDGGTWTPLREHWEVGLRVEGLPSRYPYLDFCREDAAGFLPIAAIPEQPNTLEANRSEDAAVEDDDANNEYGDEDEYGDNDEWYDSDDYPATVPGVGTVVGDNAAGEYVEYRLAVRLNDLGRELFSHVLTLADAGLLKIDPTHQEWISIAPWEWRAV